MKKWHISFFILLVLASSVLLWQKPIKRVIVSSCLQYTFKRTFNEKVYFEKVVLNKNHIALIDVQFNRKEKALKQGGVYLEAKSLDIDYKIDLLNKSLKLNIDLNSPKLEIIKAHDQILSPLKKVKKSWLKVSPSIIVNEGFISFIETDEKDFYQQSFKFNLDTQKIEEHKLLANLNLFQDKAHLKAFMAFKDDGIDCKLDFDQLQAPLFVKALKAIYLKDKPSYLDVDCLAGVLKGGIDFSWPYQKAVKASTRIELYDFIAQNSKTQVELKVPKAELFLQTKPVDKNISELSGLFREIIDQSQGYIEVFKGAELNQNKENLKFGLLPKFSTRVDFYNDRASHISLNSDLSENYKNGHLLLEGEGYFQDMRADFNLALFDQGEQKTSVRFSLNPFQKNQYKVFAQLTNITTKEVSFIQTIQSQDKSVVSWVNGSLDASCHILIDHFKLLDLEVNKFKLKDVCINNLYSFDKIQNLSANGSFNIAFTKKHPLKSLDGDIEYHLDEALVSKVLLENMQGHCQVQQGQIERAALKGLFCDVLADVKWKRNLNSSPLKLSLNGKIKDLKRLNFDSLTNCFISRFNDEMFQTQIEGDLIDQGLNLKGQLNIDEKQNIVFSTKLLKKTQSSLSDNKFFWQNLNSPFNKAIYVQDTSFEGRNLDLNKFVQPFAFNNTLMNITGDVDVKGKFDLEILSIEYDRFQLELDHPEFNLKLNSNNQKPKIATHIVNFSKKQHMGTLPVEGGVCQIKNFDLVFDQLQGDLLVKQTTLESLNFQSNCHNVDIGGKLHIDLFESGMNLKIIPQKVTGNYSDFKTLFKAFDQDFLVSLPIEAKMQLKPEEGYFFLHKGEHNYFDIELKGKCQGGYLSNLGVFPIKNICASFSFDSKKSIFELNNFKAKWALSENNHYDLFSQFLSLDFSSEAFSPFDLRVKSRTCDKARFLGQLKLNINHEDPFFKIVLDQPQNHFGDIQISNLCATFNESMQLEYLNLNFNNPLSRLKSDLKLLGHFVEQMPRQINTIVKQWGVMGQCMGQWVYDKQINKHQFYIWGDHIRLPKQAGGYFQLRGSKFDNCIDIENLSYQNLKASMKINKLDKHYSFEDISAKIDQEVYLEASGSSDLNLDQFEFNIKTFDLDFKKIAFGDFFKNYESVKNLKGSLKLQGYVSANCQEQKLYYISKLDARGNQFQVEDLLFSDEPMQLSFSAVGDKITLDSTSFKLKGAFDKKLDALLKVQNAIFCLSENNFGVENLNFEFPAIYYKSLKESLSKKFGLNLDFPKVYVSKDGVIKGSLSYLPYQKYPFALNLEKGNIYYQKPQFPLKNLSFRYGKSGLTLLVESHLFESPYWFYFKKKSYKGNSFSVFIYDERPFEDYDQKMLVDFSMDKSGDYFINKIQGHLKGIKLDFVHRKEKDSHRCWALMGQAQFKGDQLSSKLPKKYQELIEKMQMGKGYFLSGQLNLSKEKVSNFSFSGLFGAQDFDVFGYQFKNLSSKIELSNQLLEIRDLKVTDLSGELFIKSINVQKDQVKRGFLHIPIISLKNFKPSLLQVKDQKETNHKPLIVDLLEFKCVSGYLDDLDSLKGFGSLSFHKPPKKQGSILDIPVHLISKLGLDLTMLNPVEGKILYEIKKSKVVFTKFIDVYSHDKRCNFNLAKQVNESYLDFKGNLDIRIKMKQNVILKITEPFLISVEGFCLNPRYSLTRKKVHVDVPEKQAH